MNASISDMSKWLLALLGNYPKVLDDSILQKIASPVIVSPLKYRYIRHWESLSEKYYGLGWRIYFYRGRKIVYHGGYVKGYRAEVAFCPEEKLGIAFLQNSPNFVASVSVPYFFDLMFNEPDSTQVVDPALFKFDHWFDGLPDSQAMIRPNINQVTIPPPTNLSPE